MLFGDKFERAREVQREQNGLDDEDEEFEIERPPLKDEMEKGDMPAMLLAGCLTIWPICLAILLFMCGAAWLLFRLF